VAAIVCALLRQHLDKGSTNSIVTDAGIVRGVPIRQGLSMPFGVFPASKAPPAAKADRSAAAQKMQKVLRQATIPIPPAIYRNNPSNSQLERALEELLDKHGLSRNSEPKQIDRVKKKLQLNRDLEGMQPDASSFFFHTAFAQCTFTHTDDFDSWPGHAFPQ
jgi:hypothetical protein